MRRRCKDPGTLCSGLWQNSSASCRVSKWLYVEKEEQTSVEGLVFIYWDTLWKIWIRIGYFIWLIDGLTEKVFDLIVGTIGYGKIASFFRTYGTRSMTPCWKACARASAMIESRDEGENQRLWRCYYGWALFKETLLSYFKKMPEIPCAPILTDEEVGQLLEAMQKKEDEKQQDTDS